MSDTERLWQFDQVTAQDPERAIKLQSAPTWTDLMSMISAALHASVSNGTVRFGFNESGRNAIDLRVVVQFPIGADLFDWFFNAHTGYRAQYRFGRDNGTAENARLVKRLRNEVATCKQGRLSCRRLNHLFEDIGPLTVDVHDVVNSLDPALSKAWFCEKLIRPDGGIQHLNVFRTGPHLMFNNRCEPWRSLWADESNAWLDLKGAFAGDAGLYQLKDPTVRAQELEIRGTA